MQTESEPLLCPNELRHIMSKNRTAVTSINSLRKFERCPGDPNPDGRYVLYWMQIHRRLYYNYALEYAVGWANKLNKPLLIFEAVRADYPWASERTHHFLLEGMDEHHRELARRRVTYYPYLEDESGQGKGLMKLLGSKAAIVISDEYPAYIMPEHNAAFGRQSPVPFITIDSNGILPLNLTEKAPTSAFSYRKILQKNFVQCYGEPPQADPLSGLQNTSAAVIPTSALQKWPHAGWRLRDRKKFVSRLPVNHNIGKIDLDGTRKAALDRMYTFVHDELDRYGEDRNHPDDDKTSRLSPWLHFGKISPHEVVAEVLNRMPEGWSVDRLEDQKGKRRGFFQADESTEGFLDEVITWRETGFHFCHHRPDYDQYESLPDWAKQTLHDHISDERSYIYSYEELAHAKTHDEIWNAAQNQLRQEGRIHNYLRMLWGKKVLEWTPDPQTALEYLIDLNNWYAIDGRDPNSYSGIFWIFGRFDRAWGPERQIFGKIRYMTSKSAKTKVRLKKYLERYNNPLFEST